MKILKYLLILIVIGAVAFLIYGKLGEEKIGPSPQPDSELGEKIQQNVESYLRETISTLSPVEPVLGGNWYVVSVEVETESKSGTVVYEDGHVQETRNFTYTTDDEGGILTLTIE